MTEITDNKANILFSNSCRYTSRNNTIKFRYLNIKIDTVLMKHFLCFRKYIFIITEYEWNTILIQSCQLDTRVLTPVLCSRRYHSKSFKNMSCPYFYCTVFKVIDLRNNRACSVTKIRTIPLLI